MLYQWQIFGYLYDHFLIHLFRRHLFILNLQMSLSFLQPVLPVQECSKIVNFLKKCQIHANSDVQGKIEFLLQIQILHSKYV